MDTEKNKAPKLQIVPSVFLAKNSTVIKQKNLKIFHSQKRLKVLDNEPCSDVSVRSPSIRLCLDDNHLSRGEDSATKHNEIDGEDIDVDDFSDKVEFSYNRGPIGVPTPEFCTRKRRYISLTLVVLGMIMWYLIIVVRYSD